MTSPIQPGATLGVLGSGQLGRMFAIAARRLGYRVHVLSPDDDTPTGQVADVEIRAAYDDLDAVAQFARAVDVVTFEFENVPAATAEAASRHVPIRPSGQILHVSQDRLREKQFVRQAGLGVTNFLAVRSDAELSFAQRHGRFPAILKTSAWGYDGKGQLRVAASGELAAAWDRLGRQPAILEQVVDFQCEVSVIVARGSRGDVQVFDPIENEHRRQILDVSVSPARISPHTADAALATARMIAERLDLVGVLCVEMFVTRDGDVLVNELAPRPHNSGHLTIDAHATCQFEQQVRAVCGLPLGSVRQLVPAAMANLLGDIWSDGEPDWAAALTVPQVKLHLYGKHEPRPGRKMGHLTALAQSTDEALEAVCQARNSLSGGELAQ